MMLAAETVNRETSYNIDITNEQQTLPVDCRQLRKAVKAVLDEARQPVSNINVAIVDDETIHDLNRKYLQHDYPTDVLSFSLGETGEPLEGQIVVSADTAFAQAKTYGWPASHELLLYVVHGTLHLVGYDDKSSQAAEQMRQAERRILATLNVNIPANCDVSHNAPQHEEHEAK